MVSDFQESLKTSLEFEQRKFMASCERENKRAALLKAIADIDAGTGDIDANLLVIARCLDALTPVERAPIEAVIMRLLKSESKLTAADKHGPAKKRKPVTIKEAAVICGVTARTIMKWESGKATPKAPDWPGREDPVALGAFQATRESQRQTKKAVKNAARCGNMDKIRPS